MDDVRWAVVVRKAYMKGKKGHGMDDSGSIPVTSHEGASGCSLPSMEKNAIQRLMR